MADSVERAPQSYNPPPRGSGVFTHRVLPSPMEGHSRGCSRLSTCLQLAEYRLAGCRPEKLHVGHLEATEESTETVRGRGGGRAPAAAALRCVPGRRPASQRWLGARGAFRPGKHRAPATSGMLSGQSMSEGLGEPDMWPQGPVPTCGLEEPEGRGCREQLPMAGGRKKRQRPKLPACAERWGTAVDVCPWVKRMLWKVVECVLPRDVSQGQGPRRVTLGQETGRAS